MNRKKIFITAIMIVILSVFVVSHRSYIGEIPQRIAAYHHTGNISLFVDGKEAAVNNVPISFFTDSAEPENMIEASEIINGDFKFRKGVYGLNLFEFEIEETEYAPITVKLGYFNTSWWHVNNYEVRLELKSNRDGSYELIADAGVGIGIDSGKTNFNVRETVLINESNNIAEVYLGGP